ncbi:YraN family protein [Paraburkholderia hayleyella]|uniref:YraN family protein n=1 Tax=Paraburkholderia hayleyella TaxID=2152889 RepID=UPI001290B73D|nr:YraN family protein [Paraburkholderia hayleyella]
MKQKTQTDRTGPPLCHAARPHPECRTHASPPLGNTRARRIGSAFEQHALTFLQRQRMALIARNVVYRGGEIDLVMEDASGTLIFVEVRARAKRQHGGAAASISGIKQQRLVRTALQYLASRSGAAPACRFDVIAFEAGRLVWLRDAFRADDA